MNKIKISIAFGFLVGVAILIGAVSVSAQLVSDRITKISDRSVEIISVKENTMTYDYDYEKSKLVDLYVQKNILDQQVKDQETLVELIRQELKIDEKDQLRLDWDELDSIVY